MLVMAMVKTDDIRSYRLPDAQHMVGSSRNWSVIREGLQTCRYEKAPVRCPCSRLAALHGRGAAVKSWERKTRE